MGGPRDLAFCPAPADDLRVENIRTTLTPDGGVVAFAARRLKGDREPSAVLPAVIAFTDATGQRLGVSISVPLAPAVNKNER